MPPWRVAQGVALGTSHAGDSIPCQDSHRVESVLLGDAASWLLVAVADGAGSASQSHLGSRAACDGAIESLLANSASLVSVDTAEECVRESFAAALRSIEELSLREGVPPRELATTLQVAAIGTAHSVFGQVGDGAMVWGESGQLRVVHWAEQEALNLTDLITCAPLEQTLRIALELSPVRRLACMTDGVVPLLLDFRSKAPHNPAFERLFAACAAAPDPTVLSDDLTRFLNSVEVNDRTDDDKTLVLAMREEVVVD